MYTQGLTSMLVVSPEACNLGALEEKNTELWVKNIIKLENRGLKHWSTWKLIYFTNLFIKKEKMKQDAFQINSSTVKTAW